MKKWRFRLVVAALTAILVVFVILIINKKSDRMVENLITLPETELVDIDPGSTGAIIGHGDEHQSAVTVTADNVCQMIAALDRPENFSLKMTTELFYGDESSASYHVLYHSGTLSLVETGQSETVFDRYALYSSGTAYLWNKGENSYRSVPVGSFTYDDSLSVPTYETVIALPEDSILSAEYVTVNGLGCIGVTSVPDDGYEDRLYISTKYGLLVYCESYYDGELIYRCNANSISIGSVSSEIFVLPDGTSMLSSTTRLTESEAE